jgi:DNA-binding HxlR family transcriptional regulator
MPLGTDYADQDCSVARALEVVGERWTLLILRDLFYGICRYNDLRKHIGLPPATLAQRLNRLIDHGVVERAPGEGVREEYRLTDKGATLWPVIYSLACWGAENYVEPERRMGYTHRADAGQLVGAHGMCLICGAIPEASEIVVQKPESDSSDPISVALREPHRLLEPLRA